MLTPSSMNYYVKHKHDDEGLVKSLLLLLDAQVIQPSEYLF